MPHRRRIQALTHDPTQQHHLRLQRIQDGMIRQEQPVDDPLLQPLKVRLVRTPRRHDGVQIVSVEPLHGGVSARLDGGADVQWFVVRGGFLLLQGNGGDAEFGLYGGEGADGGDYEGDADECPFFHEHVFDFGGDECLGGGVWRCGEEVADNCFEVLNFVECDKRT